MTSLGKLTTRGPIKIWVPKKEIVYVADFLSNRLKTPIMISGQWLLTTHDGRKAWRKIVFINRQRNKKIWFYFLGSLRNWHESGNECYLEVQEKSRSQSKANGRASTSPHERCSSNSLCQPTDQRFGRIRVSKTCNQDFSTRVLFI